MDLKNVAPPAENPDLTQPTAPPLVAPVVGEVPQNSAPEPPAEVPVVAAASQPSPAPAASAVLTLRRAGVLTSEKFVIGDDVILGRFDTESGPVDVDFAPLPEACYISRHHAQLKHSSDGCWAIQDLGSRNGTFVRAAGTTQFARISGQHPVGDGDEVALGNARFIFSIINIEGPSC